MSKRKKFLQTKFEGITEEDRSFVQSKMLYNRNVIPKFDAKKYSQLTVDQVTCLTGESYLNDAVISYLMKTFEDEFNATVDKPMCLALDSLLIHFDEAATAKSVTASCRGRSVTDLKTILFPVHFKICCHWGLAKIDLKERTVSFDDGFHLEPPEEFEGVLRMVVKTLCYLSRSQSIELGHPLMMNRFGMQDQPSVGVGSGSYGVAVFMAARSFF